MSGMSDMSDDDGPFLYLSPRTAGMSMQDGSDPVKIELRTRKNLRRRWKSLCRDIDPEASYEDVLEHIIDRHETNPEFLKTNYR